MNMRVINFGSLNIDRVYRVGHFVRPGETLSSSDLNVFCGGKGLNQSVALSRAGARAIHAGCVGRDGAVLTDYLRKSGVDVKWVRRVDTPSGHAVIQVDGEGQNAILLFEGANACISFMLFNAC